MYVLGLETSCDETSAAVVEDGAVIKSNVIASQTLLHAVTGGVVPEVASREHVQHINLVIQESLSDTNLQFADIGAIAVANRPGLLGALMVGVSAAKAVAFALQIPIVGIHHIEAHIYANFLVNPDIRFPLLCLVASGGHTQIFLMQSHGEYELIGKTLDDAAGEAFDKSARLLGLEYPGGVVIDRLARNGDPNAIKLPRARLAEGSFDFSFSGLKTAVANAVSTTREDYSIEDWAASIQSAIVDVLVDKTIKAARKYQVSSVLAAGGVAANSSLKSSLADACRKSNFDFYIPPPELCTDNAAMIACAGYYHLQSGHVDGLDLDVIATEQLA
jgi:N6-L-threonylcarbamoyladenine synthase